MAQIVAGFGVPHTPIFPHFVKRDGPDSETAKLFAAQKNELAAARPDLHLALWNPFQLFDIAAPSVVTWGYADGALEAVKAWLEGRAQALHLHDLVAADVDPAQHRDEGRHAFFAHFFSRHCARRPAIARSSPESEGA